LIDQIISEDVSRIVASVDPALFEGKRVLVTGGAGFLGSYLCDALVMLGSDVSCLDNFSTGALLNVDHLIGRSNFEVIEEDVAKFDGSQNFDYIFHLASRVSPEDYQLHPIETLVTNSQGCLRVLELAKRGRSRVLFASTSEVYGNPEEIPTPESYWGHVNPIGIRSCYDEGKRFGEALFMAYLREYGLDVRVVRIFNTYGPRIRPDGVYARALPRFIAQALGDKDITVYGDGSQTRSFAYVTDTITGILSVFCSENTAGEVFNIGDSKETTVLELAKLIRLSTQSKSSLSFSPLPADDPRRRKPNLQKAEKILTWKPSVALEEGVSRTISWFKDNSLS
jgi:UDP-glucuronate decarboxylase